MFCSLVRCKTCRFPRHCSGPASLPRSDTTTLHSAETLSSSASEPVRVPSCSKSLPLLLQEAECCERPSQSPLIDCHLSTNLPAAELPSCNQQLRLSCQFGTFCNSFSSKFLLFLLEFLISGCIYITFQGEWQPWRSSTCGQRQGRRRGVIGTYTWRERRVSRRSVPARTS